MKENKRTILTEFLLHLHPQKIDKRSVEFRRTFGLGGINALLFVILAVSGSILRFFYIPSVESAYDSIVALNTKTLLGGFVRNVHYWAAMLFVVSVFLHLLRVLYSTAIFNERKKNWYYGLALFALVISTNFAGYLLPWDQISYWAVTVITSSFEYVPVVGKWFAEFIRGGESVGQNTLLNFYVLHTSVFPFLILIIGALHFWLVRRNNGIALPKVEISKKVNVNPVLVNKEIFTALAVMSLIFLLALLFNAPLGEMANPAVSPNPTKAPWYFEGVQELLINVHPVISLMVIPLLIFAFFIYLPLVKIPAEKVGVRFYSEKGKKMSLFSAIFASALSFVLIILFEYFLNTAAWGISPFWANGVAPFLFYLIPATIFLFYLKKKFSAEKIEIYYAIASMIFASYVTMTFVTYFLRGESMKLIF